MAANDYPRARPLKRDRAILRQAGIDHITLSMDDNDGRFASWDQEFLAFGFDSRETWDLDSSMVAALYERLLLYTRLTITNDEWQKVEFNGEERTYGAWFQEVLTLCERFLLMHNEDGEDDGLSDEQRHDELTTLRSTIWSLWALVAPYAGW